MPPSEDLTVLEFPNTEPTREELAGQENCDILIEGERRVERALIDTRFSEVTRVNVIGGHTLEIVCPRDPDERKGVTVSAELASTDGIHTLKNVRHWIVDLDPDPEPETLYIEEGTPGLPPALTPEDLDQVRSEWPEMIEWRGTATAEALEPSAKPKAIVEKVSVEFISGRLKWAEILYEDLATKRRRTLTLNPRATRELSPGEYALFVRYPESSAKFQDGGTFEVEAGKDKIQLKLVETPRLQAVVVGAE